MNLSSNVNFFLGLQMQLKVNHWQTKGYARHNAFGATVDELLELVDRYAIALLKFNKTQANKEELDFYSQQLTTFDMTQIEVEVQELYTIHSCIWSLEAELKTGRESELTLEEIGRRAIEIRNYNNKRISLKNNMATKLGCVVREIKKDHLSE